MMGAPIPPMPMDDPMQDMQTQNAEEPIPNEQGGDDSEEGGIAGDVRKYAGELSQALNDYNEQYPEDKDKLNKYAINMVAAQVKGKLEGKDVNKLVNKLENGEGNEEQMQEPSEEPADFQNESKDVADSVVTEIMDELLNGRGPRKRDELKRRKDIGKNNPFVSNR